jgi:CubicO group peptidase (beta-lactamase class C family)
MKVNSKIFRLTFATLSILLFAFTNNAQTNEQLQKRQIDSVVQKIMTDNNIVGISIGIVKNDKVFYKKGYGTKEINTNSPIDSLTNFLTCSISKLFTATAIMQLVEQGKIDINKKLTDYVPDFEMKDKRYKDITIEQMLTHTSGLPNIFNKNYINPQNESTELTEFAQKLKSEKLSYAPNVTLNEKTYSNTGYNILGLVIERVTGQTFSDYVTKNVLHKVGMDSSSFNYSKINTQRRSKPHKKHWLTKKIIVSKYYPDIPQDKPCGNLNSCTNDLCKWMLENLSIYNATNNNEGVLERQTLVDMWSTKREIPTYTTSIGLGWWIVQSEKYGKYVFHVGNDPGYSATLIISPNNNFGIVILCNALYPKNIVWNKIPFEIINQFKDEWKK